MGLFKKKTEVEKLYEDVYQDILKYSFIELAKKGKSSKGTCLLNKGDIDLILCFFQNGEVSSLEDFKVREVLASNKKSVSIEELFSRAASNTANIIFQLYHIKTGNYALTYKEEKGVRRLDLPEEIGLVFDESSFLFAKEYFVKKGKKSITKDFKGDAIICVPTKHMLLYGDSNNRSIKRNMVKYMEDILPKKEKPLSNKYYKYNEKGELQEVGTFELFKKRKS